MAFQLRAHEGHMQSLIPNYNILDEPGISQGSSIHIEDTDDEEVDQETKESRDEEGA